MQLGLVLRKYQLHMELTTRDLAAEIGVSASTLCRLQRGEGMDGDTLSKILFWLLSEEEGGKHAVQSAAGRSGKRGREARADLVQ